MKKCLLLIIVLSCSLKLLGQEKQKMNPLNRKLTFSIFDYWIFMNQEYGGGEYSLLYNIAKFPNAFSNDLRSQKWGYIYKSRILIFPLIIDYDNFTGRFKMDNIYQTPFYHPEKYNLRQEGTSISLAICPLPYVNYLSEIIIPHIGFGYQWSKIQIGENKKENSIPVSSLRLSSCMWKIGCNVYMRKLPFSMIIEYEQTINKDKMLKFSFLSFGLSFNLLKTNSFKGRTPQIYVR